MNIGNSTAKWQQLQRQIQRNSGHEDAEDLLHSAFVRMIEKPDRKVLNSAAFLFRSAMNEARDGFRRARHTAFPRPLEPEDKAIAEDAPLPDETVIARQRLARIRDGLDQLAPRTKDILLMHRLEGMTYREIAEHEGISVSAVEKHIAKGLQFLTSWEQGW